MQPNTSSRHKLVRSNSCASVRGTEILTDNHVSLVSMGKNKNASIVLNKSPDDLVCGSREHKTSRIKLLLQEIKREKPLGKCPLFKMTLTFQHFVWSPSLDSIYDTQFSMSAVKSSEKSKPSSASTTTSRKHLQRSNSAISLKSVVAFGSTITEQQNSKPGALQKTNRKDAVRLNMLATVSNPSVKLRGIKDRHSTQPELASHRSLRLGAVPRYLTNRKAEWARQEEDKIKSIPDPDCPPGHVRMPESERLETLENLKRSHQEMIEEYNCLPVSKDTLRVRQRKEEIEKRLIKVEEGIRILSKPKVFVRIDDKEA